MEQEVGGLSIRLAKCWKSSTSAVGCSIVVTNQRADRLITLTTSRITDSDGLQQDALTQSFGGAQPPSATVNAVYGVAIPAELRFGGVAPSVTRLAKLTIGFSTSGPGGSDTFDATFDDVPLAVEPVAPTRRSTAPPTRGERSTPSDPTTGAPPPAAEVTIPKASPKPRPTNARPPSSNSGPSRWATPASANCKSWPEMSRLLVDSNRGIGKKDLVVWVADDGSVIERERPYFLEDMIHDRPLHDTVDKVVEDPRTGGLAHVSRRRAASEFAVRGIRNAVGITSVSHIWEGTSERPLIWGLSLSTNGVQIRSVRVALLSGGGLALWDDSQQPLVFTATDVSRVIGKRSVVSIQDNRFFLSDGTVEDGLLERLLGPSAVDHHVLRRSVVRVGDLDATDSAVLKWSDPIALKYMLDQKATSLSQIKPATCFAKATLGFVLFENGRLHAVRGPQSIIDPVPILTDVSDVSAAGGIDGLAIAAVLKDGTVKVWGGKRWSESKQLPKSPRVVPDLQNIKRVRASNNTFWFLTNDGDVRRWQATTSDSRVVTSDLPVRIADVTNLDQIEDLWADDNGGYAVALATDGSVLMWVNERNDVGSVVEVGNAGGPPARLIDPITLPGLNEVAKVLSSPTDLLEHGRQVAGVAADGVARVVVRIPTANVGDVVTVTVCGEKPDPAGCDAGQSPAEYGALGAMSQLESATDKEWKLRLDGVRAVLGPFGEAEALVVYRGPLDFTRRGPTGADVPDRTDTCPSEYSTNDCYATTRSIYLRITYAPQKRSQWTKVAIVRPPVLLVHGFHTDQSAWSAFEPAFNQGLLSVYRANYGQRISTAPLSGKVMRLVGTDPPLVDPETESRVMPRLRERLLQSHLGFTFVAPCAADQIEEVLSHQSIIYGEGVNRRECLSESIVTVGRPEPRRSFREGANPAGVRVAAAQVDVVAHSMGGLVVREIVRRREYRSAATFGQGTVHKLVTLGTPHFGTPQAVLATLAESACSRERFASGPLGLDTPVTFNAFEMETGGSQPRRIPGAAGEMKGSGLAPLDRTAASVALTTLDSESPIGAVPTALGAGAMGDVLQAADALPAFFFVRNACEEQRDPLAERMSRNRYPTIFDPKIFPNGSQAPTASDGSVPTTSAHPPLFKEQGRTFRGYVHSTGIFSITDDLLERESLQHLQDGSEAVLSWVIGLLNESVAGRRFYSVPQTAR